MSLHECRPEREPAEDRRGDTGAREDARERVHRPPRRGRTRFIRAATAHSRLIATDRVSRSPAFTVSRTVMVWFDGLHRVAEKLCTPASPETNV